MNQQQWSELLVIWGLGLIGGVIVVAILTEDPFVVLFGLATLCIIAWWASKEESEE